MLGFLKFPADVIGGYPSAKRQQQFAPTPLYEIAQGKPDRLVSRPGLEDGGNVPQQFLRNV
jgi:hypothetical protein